MDNQVCASVHHQLVLVVWWWSIVLQHALDSVTMHFVEIATTGNAQDFGDLQHASVKYGGAGASNGHGGL